MRILLIGDIVGKPGRDLVVQSVAGLRAQRGIDLVVHLRLSGHLEVVDKDEEVRYERVRFDLDNGRALSFAEPRVLGRVYLVRRDNYPPVLAGMMKMGPEPINADFDAVYLGERLRGRSAPVKKVAAANKVPFPILADPMVDSTF